jgi:hypothetical protein
MEIVSKEFTPQTLILPLRMGQNTRANKIFIKPICKWTAFLAKSPITIYSDQ